MPGDDVAPNGHVEEPQHSSEEGKSLLRNSLDDADDLAELRPIHEPTPQRPVPKRLSSLSQPRPDGTPRTTNRVRFDVEDAATIPRQSEEWIDDEDYLHSPRQDAPLLTDITPPLDSPFLSESFQPEEHLPDARPKSSKLNAIMNMANSIIGAGER